VCGVSAGQYGEIWPVRCQYQDSMYIVLISACCHEGCKTLNLVCELVELDLGPGREFQYGWDGL
jgi:hypothetical protein